MTRKEAIETVRICCPRISDSECYFETAMRVLIPELAESEDEKIREALIWHLKAGEDFVSNGVTKEQTIAWLEKQKEQPTDAKLERVIKASRSVLNNWLDGTDCPDVSGDFAELEYAIREYDGEEKQKEQKPRKFKLGDKVHWHDDNTNIITITGFRDGAYLTDSAYGPILFCDEYNWERVEQKPAEVCYGPKGDPDPAGVWKPSEEDIMMLTHIIWQYETGNKNSKVMGYLPRVEELNFLKKILDVWKN